jgi:hypothetical protein
MNGRVDRAGLLPSATGKDKAGNHAAVRISSTA